MWPNGSIFLWFPSVFLPFPYFFLPCILVSASATCVWLLLVPHIWMSWIFGTSSLHEVEGWAGGSLWHLVSDTPPSPDYCKSAPFGGNLQLLWKQLWAVRLLCRQDRVPHGDSSGQRDLFRVPLSQGWRLLRPKQVWGQRPCASQRFPQSNTHSRLRPSLPQLKAFPARPLFDTSTSSGGGRPKEQTVTPRARQSPVYQAASWRLSRLWMSRRWFQNL